MLAQVVLKILGALIPAVSAVLLIQVLNTTIPVKIVLGLSLGLGIYTGVLYLYHVLERKY